ncbi:MAGUK p55 subfamily member 4 [Fukomys damarensis]|uniref:MAGUK p55 subfamily member 4 n=1 Tax=Fukomys damarensis TaxID=885580 RepID=A0A091E0Q1_FUKDA|nr:MAGUK p55 subfamily member 4 [Fukomys damarensis]
MKQLLHLEILYLSYEILIRSCTELNQQDEDLQKMEELAQKMEIWFGQFFDHVIVNDNLQDTCAQLLSAIRKAQEEPQWVSATWISSDMEAVGPLV